MWKRRCELPTHQKESFESLINHQWFFAWYCYCPTKDQFQNYSQYEGTLLQAELLFLTYSRDTLSSGGSGCTLRTIVLCQRSSKNKHQMPSNSFEITVALLFWCSAMLGVIKTFKQPLKLWFFHRLMIFSFWWFCFWWGVSDELASDDVITLGAFDFICIKLPSCWFHCSHLFFQHLSFK